MQVCNTVIHGNTVRQQSPEQKQNTACLSVVVQLKSTEKKSLLPKNDRYQTDKFFFTPARSQNVAKLTNAGVSCSMYVAIGK